jgi:hypothetical protein
VFGDRFTDLDRSQHSTLLRLPDSQLFIDSGADSLETGPPKRVIDELIRTHHVLRRRVLRSLLIACAFALLMIATVVTAWQRFQAVQSRDNLGRQLAASEYDRAHELSQPGGDLRVALLHAIRAATVAPITDPRKPVYTDRTALMSVQLPNRLVNLAVFDHGLVHGVVSPNLAFMVAITTAYEVRAWDLNTGERLPVPVVGTIAGFTGDNAAGDERDRGVSSLLISPDSRFALIQMNGEFLQDRLCVWELKSGRSLAEQLIAAEDRSIAFSDDCRAVLQKDNVDLDVPPPEDSVSVWKPLCLLVDGEGDVSLEPDPREMGGQPIVIYQASRPIHLVANPDSGLGVVVSRDANGQRPEWWQCARTSSDGQRIVMVSASGYAAFYRKQPHPFVKCRPRRGTVSAVTASTGSSLAIDANGTLTLSSGGKTKASALLRKGELSEINNVQMKLSADDRRIAIWYRGRGRLEDSDDCGGVEIRDAATLQLLHERSDRFIPHGPDDFVRDIACVGYEGHQVMIAVGHSDSDYIRVHPVDLLSESWEAKPTVGPLSRREFLALNRDGRYAIVSGKGNAELELLPTSGDAKERLGPLQFPSQNSGRNSFGLLLRQSSRLTGSNRGIKGNLGIGTSLRLVLEPTGTQVFVNGLPVTGFRDVSPAVWSSDGNSWIGMGAVSSPAPEFGADQLVYLVDALTGYPLGEFPIPQIEPEGLGFTDHNSQVVGNSSTEEIRITIRLHHRSTPEWFDRMGPAVTGLELDTSRNIRTLSPSELGTQRRLFLEQLKNVVHLDPLAAVLYNYFGDVPAE